MAISPIATASADGNSGTASITHGLTIAANDVLVCTINVNGSGNTATDNNGATPMTARDHRANPDSAEYYVFDRVCGGSEPSSYSFTLGSSNRWSIVVRQYRGVDISSIWDVAPGATTYSTGSGASTADAPSITIGTSGACGLVLMGDDYDPTATTYFYVDNSYGNVKSESGIQYQATADRTGLSIGVTGTTVITSSGRVDYVIYQCALKPAAATGHPTMLRGQDVPGLRQIRPGRIGF